MESTRDHGVDRFVTFADAVVAIAITLLAIPVLERADTASDGFAAWWDASAFPLLGLGISFAVIARLRWAHHRIFEHVERWSGRLVRSTFAWLLSIVLLSIGTAVTTQGGAPDEDTWGFPLYLSVMVLSSALLTVRSWIVYRHPELTDGRNAGGRHGLIASVSATVGFVLVLVVGTALPAVDHFAFLLMGVTGRGAALVERRAAAR